MLELNPKDNQGARYPLIGLYIEMENLNCAAELLKKYEHDGSAMFARVLWGAYSDFCGIVRNLKTPRRSFDFK
jgi:hypothetical protein